MIAAQARGGHQGGIDALDVGFGDIITPAHVSLSYPVLLDTLPEVDILAYSLETVVPEKYQAMIDHATENNTHAEHTQGAPNLDREARG